MSKCLNAMSPIGMAATALGFIPAVIIGYKFIGKNVAALRENEILLLFGVGMIFGFITAIMYGVLGYYLQFWDLSILIFAIIMPLFINFGMFAFLNRKKRQGNIATAIHSPIIGSGFSASFSAYIIYRGFTQYLPTTQEPSTLMFMAILAIANALIYICVASLLGIGAYTLEQWHYTGRAALLTIAYNFMLMPYLWRVKYSALYLLFSLIYAAYSTHLTKGLYREICTEKRR